MQNIYQFYDDFHSIIPSAWDLIIMAHWNHLCHSPSSCSSILGTQGSSADTAQCIKHCFHLLPIPCFALCTHRHINQTISTLYYYYLHFLHTLTYDAHGIYLSSRSSSNNSNEAYFKLAYWISQQSTEWGRDWMRERGRQGRPREPPENFNNNRPQHFSGKDYSDAPSLYTTHQPRPHCLRLLELLWPQI